MISSQFFTTINFKIFIDTIKLLTFKLPYLRFWNEVEKLEQELKTYLNATSSKIYSFYNWRSALYYGLKSLNFDKNAEVMIPWYTCVSVVNAVIQAWYKPIYIDIEEDSLNINIDDVKKKFSKKTKIIIIQHTFWNPANIIKITQWAHNHWLIVIEDCAHALGAEIWDKKVWTFWDIAIFSTWRDKVISSVNWGFLLINNEQLKQSIKRPPLIAISKIVTIQNLMYNIISYIAWKTYDIKLWKLLMYIANKFKLIPKIISLNEKFCNFNNFYYQLPNSLAYLARTQLKLIDKINEHRIKIWKIYKTSLDWKYYKSLHTIKFAKNILFGYPIKICKTDLKKKVIQIAKKNNIYLWIYWSWQNIVPLWTNLKSCFYKKWSCPIAEKISKQIIILPNHYQINKNGVNKIISLLNWIIKN